MKKVPGNVMDDADFEVGGYDDEVAPLMKLYHDQIVAGGANSHVVQGIG